jgi:hypothetical protein
VLGVDSVSRYPLDARLACQSRFRLRAAGSVTRGNVPLEIVSEPWVQLVREHLGATGVDGFEGLIAELLEGLTGRRFRIARSGSQQGRDLTSEQPGVTAIAVECKRYGEDTDLSENDLVAKLTKAVLDMPELDLWVLATTRPVDAQTDQVLRRASTEFGTEYRAVDTGSAEPSELAALLAQGAQTVLRFVAKKASGDVIEAIRLGLDSTVASARFESAVRRLRHSFSPAVIGYDSWRQTQRQSLLSSFADEALSRAHFGQTILASSSIRREACLTALDAWYENWRDRRRPIAILGDEGDGKTWAVASWIATSLDADADFPGVVFLNARDVGASDPLELLVSSVSPDPGRSAERWARKFTRWCATQTDTRPTPAVLLVLDGINEKPRVDWRSLLEALSADRWRIPLAVILTCRTLYWRRHFDDLAYLEVVQHIMSGFTDVELDAALSAHSLIRSGLPESLIRLLRKPRYFDLAVRRRQRLAESGDITPQRLIYEDQKDRYQRKAGTLDDQAYQSVLMELARRARTGETRFAEDDVERVLPRGTDRDAVLVDLSTSGVFVASAGLLRVEESRLTLGMGLLLSEEVRECASRGDAVHDLIEQWLEPEAGLDIKGSIVEAASVHALSTHGYPLPGAIALLRAWANVQNAPGREDTFPAYLPLWPDAYLGLAEWSWGEEDYQHVLHPLILSALLRFRDSPRVQRALVSRFQRWLGYVHPAGFAGLYGVGESELEAQRLRIATRIGHSLSQGPIEIAGRQLLVIEHAGLLRLARLALAVISCGDSRPFVSALATGAVAEAVMGFGTRGEVFRWVIRSAPHSLERDLLRESAVLTQVRGTVGERAARYLLESVGTAEAYETLKSIPQDPSPFEWDPCRHHVPWRSEDCLKCLTVSGFEVSAAARAMVRGALDPSVVPPTHFVEQLAALDPGPLVQTMWMSASTTVEDHEIERKEATFCAYAPDALARTLLRAASWFVGRTGHPLQVLTWQLAGHSLIFGQTEWSSLREAWEKLVDYPTAEQHRHVETQVFLLLLNGLGPEEQLRCLVRRPHSAPDLLSFEALFCGPPPVMYARELMHRPDTPAVTLQRILWFLFRSAASLPSDIIDAALRLTSHTNALLRGTAMAVLHRSRSMQHIVAFLQSDWHASNAQHRFETNWGSHLWIDYAHDHSFQEIRGRIAPEWWGEAVAAREFRPDEVFEYSIELTAVASPAKPLPPLPAYQIARDQRASEGSHDLLDPRVAPSNPTAFVSRANTWGDTSAPDAADAIARAFDVDARFADDNAARARVISAADEQTRAGNPWLVDGPPATALEAVCRARPELVSYWLDLTAPERQGEITFRQAGFFERLCVALLTVRPADGLVLRNRLFDARGAGLTHWTETGVAMIDGALWSIACNQQIGEARWKMIRESRTDLDLSRVAVAAETGGQVSWLRDQLEGALSCDSLLDRSRAVTILGLMSDGKAESLFTSWASTKSADWVDSAVAVAQQRRKMDKSARHWFGQFVNANDDVHAWAGFRLFLQCVDRRFWVWRSELECAAPATFSDKRKRFLASQKSAIASRLKESDGPLKKVFGAAPVLNGQVAPWITDA